MRRGGGGPDVAALLLFAAVVVIGGSNFLAVRYSNQELPPFWGAGLRFSLAAVVFVLLAIGLRLRWPGAPAAGTMVVFGLLNFGVAFAISYWALQFVTAATATVVVATVPLATLLLASAQGLDRMGARSLGAALLALAGIGWLALGPGDTTLPLPAGLALLAGSFVIGQSIILGKRVAGHNPILTNAIAMSAGAGMLLALSRAAGESWWWPQQPAALIAVLYMVVFGSVLLFVLTLLLVRRWTPSATAYALVLFPVVTPLLESSIAGVPITTDLMVAAALVVAAVWFGALAPARSAAPSVDGGGASAGGAASMGAAAAPGEAGTAAGARPACCTPADYGAVFRPSGAEALARRFRRSGPSGTSADVLALLGSESTAGATVLEAGAGVGEVLIPLLERGAARAVDVDLSPHWAAAAARMAAERGVADRLETRVGDFAALAGDLPPADVVVLNRVLCCDPDWRGLIDAAVGGGPRLLALSLPLDTPWVRGALALANLAYRLRGLRFRVFVHDASAIDDALAAAGYRLRRERRGLVWRTAVYGSAPVPPGISAR